MGLFIAVVAPTEIAKKKKEDKRRDVILEEETLDTIVSDRSGELQLEDRMRVVTGECKIGGMKWLKTAIADNANWIRHIAVKK